MGRRQILKDGDEWDLLSSKRIHCYFNHAGKAAEIKRRMNRRARQSAQAETEQRLETALDDNNIALRGTRIVQVRA